MVPKPRMINNIVDKFTVKTIPNIKGYPNYKSIKGIIQLLNTNVATLPTPQGGGYHIHTSLIMNPTIYITLYNMVWVGPSDPGVYPTFPYTNIVAHYKQLKQQNDDTCLIYNNVETMDEALKKKVTNTIEDTYIKHFKNKYTTFLGVTCRHLFGNLIKSTG